MPNKCGVFNCKGNYNASNKCRVFKIPKNEEERQRWLAVLPPRDNFQVDPEKFFVCEKHWPADHEIVKIPGGTRPANPPSIFDVPASCLPTPKPQPRRSIQEDRQLEYFKKKDKITALEDFLPDKELQDTYKNVIITRPQGKFVLLFLTEDFRECELTVVVESKQTLCSPLVLSAYKAGVRVPLGKILHPNNGLSSYSQFHAAVHFAYKVYELPLADVLRKVVTELQTQEVQDSKKAKKLGFLTNNLKLLADKQYSTADYCFAVESFPHCDYELLREYLVLPSKRKVHGVISAVNIRELLVKCFQKVKDQQKNVFLLVDEVKIRPTVAFSGGVLNGMAKNDPDAKASSMLCVMMKCLYRGPSVMVSVTPVHRVTASFQFNVVKEAATVVEQSGGTVLGSITDNHKINQLYCKLFNRPSESECPATATHPLDNTRSWYLLFDTVHLLKCIRNNWISEKCQKLTFDNQVIGSFSDVKRLYDTEKENILKTSPLTDASVRPSKLQLQNVQHVLKVFNEKVVAALRVQGCHETANFIQSVLDWWNVVNVSSKGQDIKLRDPHRREQDITSTNLVTLHEQFKQAPSGHGTSREQCMTHDTKKALTQTMQGLSAVCKHLLTHANFKFVLLRELQSDRIEGEFSVYRQATGANAFMTSADVVRSSKKRLARHAAAYLEDLDFRLETKAHSCVGPALQSEDASFIEACVGELSLSAQEESSAAYVAGWVERKCQHELNFDDEEPLVPSEVSVFIQEVSKGALTVPHQSTYDLVRYGLAFVKKARHRACCRQRMVVVLATIGDYLDIIECDKLRGHVANVLLSGLHNLEKDRQKNGVLLQTSIKRARLSD